MILVRGSSWFVRSCVSLYSCIFVVSSLSSEKTGTTNTRITRIDTNHEPPTTDNEQHYLSASGVLVEAIVVNFHLPPIFR